jgi:hypothetical protein
LLKRVPLLLFLKKPRQLRNEFKYFDSSKLYMERLLHSLPLLCCKPKHLNYRPIHLHYVPQTFVLRSPKIKIPYNRVQMLLNGLTTFIKLNSYWSFLWSTIWYGADCPRFCNDVFKPVCGSNGATYGNECRLNRASCIQVRKQMQNISKKSDGECTGSVPDYVSEQLFLLRLSTHILFFFLFFQIRLVLLTSRLNF